ncbi:penicillin-binding protein 1C [Sediminitomix flava]|uniref:peptidoglycan glycosyltransferase n=1 Tax=Sediminitomix flava TaxID=379075 RepID=A0A315ZF44_SEDFL|nr:penicillin-binding protein 1C [Sediminitomix flava]PWJ43780.1 penicillin-binding protein 1C [Sediminitomix flava]
MNKAITHILQHKIKIGISLLLIGFFYLIPLPKPLFNAPYVTTLESTEGELLSAMIADDQQWRFPESDSMPYKFENAIRLFEDEYFYYHFGVNPISIMRAISQNISQGRIVSGGSTISMQTIRMAFGNQERTYGQKLIELFSALKLEAYYSKTEILQAYADHAPFGGNIVGLKAASYRYFGRPAHKLSWAESAMLAILPNNPSSIFPGKNQEKLKAKRDRLLLKIHENGFLTKDELYLAQQEKLPNSLKPLPNSAYHLLHRAISEGHKGENIKSTLQSKLQKEVDRKLNRYARRMRYNQIHNAAAIVLDTETGNTLAYVGNAKGNGDHGQHVDIITAQRSPGSLLKPILYAAALDEGLIMPKQLLPDKPLFYKGFTPKNFDKKYRGVVPADDALVSSLNVPFVHLLLEYGYEKFHQKLQNIGFKSFHQPAYHYGLSMILGGGETSLWEITSVYSSMVRALNNYTERPLRKGYSKEDYHSNYYIPRSNNEVQKLESDGFLRAPSIRYTLDAMQRVERPDQEAGWQYYGSSKNIAWKTGTSYGHRDAWAIGINGKYLVGVWIGNADGEGRPGLTGVSAAAPLMFDLFTLVDGSLKLDQYFGEEKQVCSQSGMLANKNCQETHTLLLDDYMTKGNTCTYHKVLHLNQEETHQVNSSCYNLSEMKNKKWFVLPPVEAWYYQKFKPNYQSVPPYLANCEQTESKTYFDLIYPSSFRKVHIPLDQEGQLGQVIFEAAHEDVQTQVYWHLDNTYLGVTKATHQMGIQAEKGIHLLTLVDEMGNEIRQKFEVVD